MWLVTIGNKQDGPFETRGEARDHAYWLRNHPEGRKRLHFERSTRVRVVRQTEDTSKLAKAIRRLRDVNDSLKGVAGSLDTDDPKLKPLEDAIGDIKLTLLDLHQVYRKL